jgi:DNA invertase Pin-like site-specific DNA recombinase
MNTKEVTTNEKVSEVERGKYRDCYLVYNRKSTDEPDNQKNSIKYQKSQNALFAYREHLPVARLTLEGFSNDGIVSERHSGFKEDIALQFGEGNTVQFRIERPKFHRLVQWLGNGYFKGAIFLCWDRASRNQGDDTILRKLMKRGVDIRFVSTTYEKTSSGELHMDIDGMFAQHYSRVTSEKIAMTLQTKRDQGVCTYRAPVGYLNQGQMEHKPLDSERAPIVRKLFELYATGGWSLIALTRWAIDQGLTMPPTRRRRTQEEILAEEEDDVRVEIEPVSRLPAYTAIDKILRNRFYMGEVRGNGGTWVKSTSHEALVSEELFNRVQIQLRRKNKSAHYANVIAYPLRAMVRCGVCGRVYTPYQRKGIMYYGARCSAGCVNPKRSFNFDFITEKIGARIAALSFTEEELHELDAEASTESALVESKRLGEREANARKKKRIREDLAYLNANRLTLLKTGAYTPEVIVAEEARLALELSSLENLESASDVEIQETVRDTAKLSELLEDVYFYYQIATPQEKEDITREIFSELTLQGETLEYKCTRGFQPLASRFVSQGGPKAWLSELLVQRKYILASMQKLAPYVEDARPTEAKQENERGRQ